MEPMAKKFYAVRKGRQTGIFHTWKECQEAVHGYSGAVFKSFLSEDEAIHFLKGLESDVRLDVALPFAFVDGSFNQHTKVYGYGGFLEVSGKRYYLQGQDSKPDMAAMRNVAGELLGSMAAIKKALELGVSELIIYYDYAGIEMWATGSWKRNKTGTIAYHEYVQSVKDRICLHFSKVKSHSGIPGNEEADRLAKEAVGL